MLQNAEFRRRIRNGTHVYVLDPMQNPQFLP
jgi:hypothetical protein